jgi:hypothetical protein
MDLPTAEIREIELDRNTLDGHEVLQQLLETTIYDRPTDLSPHRMFLLQGNRGPTSLIDA